MSTAVVVIGIQRDVMEKRCEHIISRISKLLSYARNKGIDVFHACDTHYEMAFTFKKLGTKPRALSREREGQKLWRAYAAAQGRSYGEGDA